MDTIVIACSIFRKELEKVASQGQCAYPMKFFEFDLHKSPEYLRNKIQNEIIAFEEKSTDAHPTIILGYGLCGRALNGVHAKRSTLVLPRVHDCIPMIMGLGQSQANATSFSRDGATLWSSQGMLEYTLVPFYLHPEIRRAVYVEKFGEKKAEKMMKAESHLLDAYKSLCHIKWEGEDPCWVRQAQDVARATNLPYTEIMGNTSYVHDLVLDNADEARFLHLDPGQTLDMDVDGTIIAAEYKES